MHCVCKLQQSSPCAPADMACQQVFIAAGLAGLCLSIVNRLMLVVPFISRSWLRSRSCGHAACRWPSAASSLPSYGPCTKRSSQGSEML